MRAKSRKIYMQRLVVRMAGGVPFDMLRYDSCWPATGDDAGKLETLSRDHKPPVEVTLIRASPSVHGPEIDRWESFGCKVVSWEPIA